MRYRATAATAVVAATLGLSVLAVPAARAVVPDVNTHNTMNVTFSRVNVDKGAASVAAGTTNTVKVPYTYRLTATGVDPSKHFTTSLDLYRGAVTKPASDLSGNNAACHLASKSSGTVVEDCSGTVDVRPHSLTADDAGATWKAVAYAYDSATGGWAQHGTFPAPTIKRWATQTVHATPASAAKGATITVTGTLTRASWDTHAYWGYAGQPVKLQFRPRTSGTYTTVRTVTTNADGAVRATAKATVSGYWRWSFAGTATTVASTPAGTSVAVR